MAALHCSTRVDRVPYRVRLRAPSPNRAPQEEEAIGIVLIETEAHGRGGDHGHHGDQASRSAQYRRAEKDHQGRGEERDGETGFLEESKTEQRVRGAVERREADSPFGKLYVDLLIEEGLFPRSFDARLCAEEVAMADVRERTAVNEADSREPIRMDVAVMARRARHRRLHMIAAVARSGKARSRTPWCVV
jgi:hypothetical protein